MSRAEPSPIEIGLNAVILAVTDEQPRVLTTQVASTTAGGPVDALPSGPLDPDHDRTLELALRGWVRTQTDLTLGYVEQLYTYGDRNRDPRQREGGPRMISIGYLSLVREPTSSSADALARWRAWYGFLPWEDWRSGRPAVLAEIGEALDAWVAERPRSTRAAQRERVDIAFGSGGATWDGERVLDRYELLYEAGLVAEAARDHAERAGVATSGKTTGFGRIMAVDHRRIAATALGRIRGKIRYRPVVFELLPPTFTLLQLQRVVEALAGKRLHKQNFRRLVDKAGLVEGTGMRAGSTGGRPAELFRFRRDVLRERPTPGVGLPGLPRAAAG